MKLHYCVFTDEEYSLLKECIDTAYCEYGNEEVLNLKKTFDHFDEVDRQEPEGDEDENNKSTNG